MIIQFLRKFVQQQCHVTTYNCPSVPSCKRTQSRCLGLSMLSVGAEVQLLLAYRCLTDATGVKRWNYEQHTLLSLDRWSFALLV
jgi:hypothetical protein